MKRLVYIAALIFLATCTQEEITSREYPRVRTLEVANITASGALFRGTVFYAPSPMTDHGFIWAELPNLDLKNAELVSLGPKTGTGDFQAKIERSMEAGKKYYARAYAKTDKYEVYGDILSFVSLGSDAPKITQLKPSSGHTLDTIRILGSNFSRISKYVKVKFDTLQSTLVEVSDSSLRVIVPATLSTPSAQVTVSVLGNIGTSPALFQLIGPTISVAVPTQVAACDTLKITGSNFSTTSNSVKVTLGGYGCSVISVTSTRIVALAPIFSPVSTLATLEVTSSNIKEAYANPINYLGPIITGISPSSNITFLDTLTFTGSNIPVCGALAVTFGPVNTVALQRSATSIKVVVPTALTSSTNSLKLNFDNGRYIYQTNLTLSDPVITSISPSSATFGDVITISGKNFHPTLSRNTVIVGGMPATVSTATQTQIKATINNSSANCGLYNRCNEAMVQVTDTWAISNALSLKKPVITSIIPVTLTSAGQLTITGQFFSPVDYNTVQFGGYRLTPVINSSTTLIVDIPLNVLTNYNSYFSFTKTETLNVNVGEYSNPSIPNSLYSNTLNVPIEYEGPWTILSPFQGNYRYMTTSFTIGDKGYLIGGNSYLNEPIDEVWEYTSNTDTWQQLTPFPGGVRSRAIAFAANGKGYVMMGQSNSDFHNDVWEFDPTTSTWTQLADFPGPKRYQPFTFLVNGVNFVGGGGPDERDFWAFDPATRTWTQKQSLPITVASGAAFGTPSFGAYAFQGQEVWHYDPVADSWNKKNDVLISLFAPRHATNFGDLGYVFTFSGFYEYNPQNDSWRQLVNIPDGQNLGVGFKINDRYYYGLQLESGGSVKPLYRLNMEKYPNP